MRASAGRLIKLTTHLPTYLRAMSSTAAEAGASGRPKVAVAQMTATSNREDNLRACQALAEQAKDAGAAMLFLPECFSLVGSRWQDTVAAGQAIDGPVMQRMAELARSKGLWMSLGGFPERMEAGDKVFNTHVILDDQGKTRAVYRKIHLFDVNVPDGPVMLESRYTAAGSEPVVVDSPVGRLGLSTCYDLRFPELYMRLLAMGAEVMLVPSAFTVPTGKAHWETLLRSRAIENQCYVLAAAQAGKHNDKRESYGHAVIIDPWGKVLADAGGEASPVIVTAEIDLEYLASIRAKIPIQSHRRKDILSSLL